MAEKRIRGIASIKFGDILPSGGMGTTLTALGVTYEGTARLETADPTITDFYSEENDNPEETIITPGKTTLTFNIIDWTNTTLVRILGGSSSTSKQWDMPSAYPSIELSCEITCKSPAGFKINIPRLGISGKIVAELSKTALGQVQIIGTVLQPTLAGLAPLYTAEP